MEKPLGEAPGAFFVVAGSISEGQVLLCMTGNLAGYGATGG